LRSDCPYTTDTVVHRHRTDSDITVFFRRRVTIGLASGVMIRWITLVPWLPLIISERKTHLSKNETALLCSYTLRIKIQKVIPVPDSVSDLCLHRWGNS